MLPLNYLLAFAILSSPADTMVDQEYFTPDICQSIKEVSLYLEILDRREAGIYLFVDLDFASDINFLRQRYKELKNAPPLHDCIRFPPKEHVRLLLATNKMYASYLEKQRVLYPNSDFYKDALEETNELYKLYYNILDVRDETMFVTVRRTSLKSIKDRIGCVAFYNGQLPPHVPIWRFRSID